jgi:hypothetical protein
MWTRRLSEVALAGWLGLVALDARADPPAPAPDDSLASYRDRFKQGMDLYEHGAAAQAIATWEPIYRDLGEQRGYRVAYDLGVAYAALGDAPHAGERLQAFVSEVDARRGRGEALEAAVTKDESDARARLAGLVPILARIRVAPATPPSVVRVDAGDPRTTGFLAWVRPGPHAVVFDPGTRAERTIAIEVAAGAMVELVPPPPPAAPETPSMPGAAPALPAAPAPAPPAAPASPASSRPSALSAPGVEPAAALGPPLPHAAPFPPLLMAIGGGVTLAAVVAAVALEIHANDLHDRYVAEQAHSPDGTIPAADRSSFATARTWAYLAVGASAGLAGVTGGLVLWYLVDRTPGETAPSTSVAIALRGPRAVLEASF